MNVPEFKDFWKAYPPRYNERRKRWEKADRFHAEIEWMKMKDKEKIAAMAAVGDVEKGKFTPDARKWLKHKRWQTEIVEPPKSQSVQQATCHICRKPASSYLLTPQRKPIYLCPEDKKAAKYVGCSLNRPIAPADLERRIEWAKAEMQKRSMPPPKDPELVREDRKWEAMQKLRNETIRDFGKGG